MLDSARSAWMIALAAASACQPVDRDKGTVREGERPADTVGPDAHDAVPSTASAPAEEVPESRRCGEAGPGATPLPPGLALGLETIGAGEIGPGESLTLGTVVVKYDPDAWIGPRSGSGHRGAALEALVDRADVGEGMPWGHDERLSPNRQLAFHIGPYYFHGSTSMGDPPQRVSIAVERRACPDHAVVDEPPETIWLWVSTEALRLYTIQRKGHPMLQVGIRGDDGTPRLEVSMGLWRHALVATPGAPASFRANDRIVTIEEVVPGAGTRFEGSWQAEGVAHAHARVRVEPAAPVAIDPAVVATTACGEPTSARTELPPALAVTPRVGADVRIAVGQTKPVGDLDLELVARTIEGDGWRREPEQFRDLVVRGDGDAMTPSSLTFGRMGAEGHARAGKLLLFADEESTAKGPRVRVRAIELACPRTTGIHTLSGPTHAWLSTIGHEVVTLGAGVHPRLTVQLHADPRSPSLAASSEHASLSETVAPELVGHAFALDGELVEIVDVVAGADTKREEWGWSTRGLLPTLHVQVRISVID